MLVSRVYLDSRKFIIAKFDTICKDLGFRNSDIDAVYELDFVVIDC